MPQASVESNILKLTRSHRVTQKSCCTPSAAFTVDGASVAIAYRSFGKDASSNRVLVWNLQKWREVKSVAGCTASVDGVAFSADGAFLACAGNSSDESMGGGEVNLWCTRTWKKFLARCHTNSRHNFSFLKTRENHG